MDDVEALINRCGRFLNGHGQRTPAALLGELPADIARDVYGGGGVVAEVEAEVARLLGAPAAVFLPSGVMAQQAALRVHADSRGRRTVLMHPTAHPALHEDAALTRLHALLPRLVGDARRLLRLADLEAVAEPPAALLLELPQREIGGQLPVWDDLIGQVAWARSRGAAVHLDGARLWECGPAYDRPLADIAALFDTTYVSFYKGLGGLAGCCLAGSDDVVAEVAEWRRRLGGTIHGLWPYAASALAGLRRRLPRMPEYAAHARAVAAALVELPGVVVVPDPPVTPMLHVFLPVPPPALDQAMRALAERDGVWTWARSTPVDLPTWARVELTVGDATLEWTPAEVRDLVAGLMAAAGAADVAVASEGTGL